ncbi:MAG: hypothetical protein WKF97_24485 [Chitinophagaceae bacterium]
MDKRRNDVRLLQNMAEEKSDALGCHVALAIRAAKCFVQIEQVLYDKVRVEVSRNYIWIVREQIAQFGQVVGDRMIAVVREFKELAGFF